MYECNSKFNPRMSSNLRPTTHECMHLVTHSHFWSRDKNGGHITRSALAENTVPHKNVIALSVIAPELWAIEFYIGNGEYGHFCSCDLDLDPSYMNLAVLFRDTPHVQISNVKAFESYHLMDIHTYRQTDIQRHYQNCIPRHFTGGQ